MWLEHVIMQSDRKTRRVERKKQRVVESSKRRKRENNLGENGSILIWLFYERV
jgi:hypothetical protein